MYSLYALIFIFLLEISGPSGRKTEGKLDEKASKECSGVGERTTEKCVFSLEITIPRAPRSIRKCKTSKTPYANFVAGHTSKIRNCSECGLLVRGNKAFEKHALSRHEGMKLVPCEKCDKKFSVFQSVYSHMRVWHKREDKCKFCRKICSSEALEVHEETCVMAGNANEIKERKAEWTLTPYCEPCVREFSSHASYRYHCRTSHPGEKIFPCRFCFKRFTSHNYLGVHLEKYHAVEMLAVEKPRKYSRGLAFSCPHCDIAVTGTRKYEQHGKNYHPGLAMFQCGTCGERFCFKKSADRHAKESHGEDKTCCRYCSKCYSRADRMKEHEDACCRKKAALEAKKARAFNKQQLKKDRMGRHYCDICHKTMYVLDRTFERHVSTHEDFDYCDMCDDRFERKGNPDGLEKHMKMRHPLRDNVDALLKTARTLRVKFEKEEEIGKSEVLTGWHWEVCSASSSVVQKSECDDED